MDVSPPYALAVAAFAALLALIPNALVSSPTDVCANADEEKATAATIAAEVKKQVFKKVFMFDAPWVTS